MVKVFVAWFWVSINFTKIVLRFFKDKVSEGVLSCISYLAPKYHEPFILLGCNHLFAIGLKFLFVIKKSTS